METNMNLFLSILITIFLIGVLLSIIYIIVGFILEKKAKKAPVEENVDTSNVPYLKQEESQQEEEQPIVEEPQPVEEEKTEEPVVEEPKEEKKAPRKRASSRAKSASKEDKKED